MHRKPVKRTGKADDSDNAREVRQGGGWDDAVVNSGPSELREGESNNDKLVGELFLKFLETRGRQEGMGGNGGVTTVVVVPVMWPGRGMTHSVFGTTITSSRQRKNKYAPLRSGGRDWRREFSQY
jgi:hypothetical protein